MTNPMEERVFQYIMERRGLRVFFLATTFLGVAKGAFDLLTPIARSISGPVLKALPISPPPEMLERNTCALDLPEIENTLLIFLINQRLKMPPDRFDWSMLFKSQNDIRYCQQLFGFTSGLETLRRPEESGELPKVIETGYENTLISLASFSGYLANKDPSAARLYGLSKAVLTLQNSLQRCRSTSECDMFAPPSEEARELDELRTAESAAAAAYAFRMPSLALDTESRHWLLTTLACYSNGLSVVIKGKSPVADPHRLLAHCPYVKVSAE